MEQLNINQILDRKKEEELFIDCIKNFENNKNNILVKRGVYIFGAPGSGKTTFVKEILKTLNYEVFATYYNTFLNGWYILSLFDMILV